MTKRNNIVSPNAIARHSGIMKFLEESAEKERQISQTVAALSGTPEERMRRLEALDTFAQYNRIYTAYAERCGESLEALKRALFLSWFAHVEHPAYTGLRAVDKSCEQKVLHKLRETLQKHKADYELKWMLSHYAAAQSYFESFGNAGDLPETVKKHFVALPACIDKNAMEKRGLMGVFWNFFFFFMEG